MCNYKYSIIDSNDSWQASNCSTVCYVWWNHSQSAAGFLSELFYCHYLLSNQHFLINSVENCLQINCISTNFSKCFHRVNHIRYFSKLRWLGFVKHKSIFICVGIGNFISNEFEVPSGVPHGFILQIVYQRCRNCPRGRLPFFGIHIVWDLIVNISKW